jgi:hypothetical protein
METAPKIKLDEMEELNCGSCGHNRFVQKITMRRISPLQMTALTGGATDAKIQPFGIICCDKCGAIYEAPKIITK